MCLHVVATTEHHLQRYTSEHWKWEMQKNPIVLHFSPPVLTSVFLQMMTPLSIIAEIYYSQWTLQVRNAQQCGSFAEMSSFAGIYWRELGSEVRNNGVLLLKCVYTPLPFPSIICRDILVKTVGEKRGPIGSFRTSRILLLRCVREHRGSEVQKCRRYRALLVGI